METYNVEAWRRYLARMLDNWIIFAIFMAIFYPTATKDALRHGYLISSITSTMGWVLIEPVFLSLFGATLGKWLFRIKLRDQSNNKLSYHSAFKRSALVCIQGLALGIPILHLLTSIKAYSDLTIHGVTAWDKTDMNIVTYESIGPIWLTFIILPILIFFFDVMILTPVAVYIPILLGAY